MSSPDLDVEPEQALRPLRLAAAALAVLQLVGLLALLVVLFVAGAGLMVAGYVIAGAIVLLEFGQLALSKTALRRAPAFDPRERYELLPLDAPQQRIVELNLVIAMIAPVLLAMEVPTTSFRHEKFVAFVLLTAAFAPSDLSLWRVRRNHSWLAVSRIPAKPRRR